MRILVLGATGLTGKHFVTQALADNHQIRALVRSPSKLTIVSDNLEVCQGSITEDVNTNALVKGVDCVILMLGDRTAQQHSAINTAFVKKLVPSMRQNNVKRLLYQAGGLSRPHGGSLSPLLWILRNTIARGFDGQHKDNEEVMRYLATEAMDIDWICHRAALRPTSTVRHTAIVPFSILPPPRFTLPPSAATINRYLADGIKSTVPASNAPSLHHQPRGFMARRDKYTSLFTSTTPFAPHLNHLNTPQIDLDAMLVWEEQQPKEDFA